MIVLLSERLKEKNGNTTCFIFKTINSRNFKLPPRTNKYKRRSVYPLKLIPHSKDIEKFEKQEMTKSRLVIKEKLNECYEI